MRQCTRAAFILLAVSAHGCSASDDTLPSVPEVAAVAQAVVGGESIEACNWPSTVSVNAWGSCSGTLIHSRIVTTAAHCLAGDQTNIFFGAGRNSPGSFSLPAVCKAGAQGARGANTGADWAYCVLPEDARVAQIPITPPLVGCEADKYLKSGVEAWVVGFGTTSAEGLGAGVKRQVPVLINAIDKPTVGTLNVGDAEQGACHGDSGGPLYVHLKDGAHDWGYRVIGSTSGAGESLCDCTCSTVYVNIANHVRQIEANENIDVTPCTDANGAFEPSAACNALSTALQDGAGVFPSCSGGRMLEPMNSCGTEPIVVAEPTPEPTPEPTTTMPPATDVAGGPAPTTQPLAGSAGAPATGMLVQGVTTADGNVLPGSFPTGAAGTASLAILPPQTAQFMDPVDPALASSDSDSLKCEMAHVRAARRKKSLPAALALVTVFALRQRRRRPR